MSKFPTVKLHWAERLLNFVGGSRYWRISDSRKLDRLANDKRAFDEMAPFLDKLKAEAERETVAAIVAWLRSVADIAGRVAGDVLTTELAAAQAHALNSAAAAIERDEWKRGDDG